jgi:hypothetical protein
MLFAIGAVEAGSTNEVCESRISHSGSPRNLLKK